MADNETNEMMSAFALGCMDKLNYREFKNHIRRGGNLPKGELGDLQNIIALIPTVLYIVPALEWIVQGEAEPVGERNGFHHATFSFFAYTCISYRHKSGNWVHRPLSGYFVRNRNRKTPLQSDRCI